MKITFLGTSHGVPEAHRLCSCSLITVGEGENASRYFIDMGMQPVGELVNRGIPLESVKAVFLTHMHGDHTDGVLSLVDLCSWYFKKALPTFFYPEQAGIDVTKSWVEATGCKFREEIPMKLVEEGPLYDDGVLKVTAYRTKHCAVSYAYLLEAEGKRVLFTGDLCTKGPAEDFPVQAAKDEALDLVVCECAHFGAMTYEPIFRNCKLKRVLVNHYQPRRTPEVAQLAQALAPLPVALANDGLEVTV